DNLASCPSGSVRLFPTIDIAPFVSANSHAGARDAIVDEVVQALTKLGFILIAGHGVTTSIIEETFAIAREFFAQPVDEKLRSVGLSETSIGYSIRGASSYKTHSNRTRNDNFKEILDLGPPDYRRQRNIYPAVP